MSRKTSDEQLAERLYEAYRSVVAAPKLKELSEDQLWWLNAARKEYERTIGEYITGPIVMAQIEARKRS